MGSIDQSMFGDADSDVVEITPPGATKSVYLRYPSFGEWHDLATAHQGLDGKAPAAELITKTLSVCLADSSGKRLADTPSEAKGLLKLSPRRVMYLYRKCWETVLKSDEESVEELEKNSAASRD